MAESISEGTLKTWNKRVGDPVEQDEEVATIETDKIDVSVNSPQSGVITELLAKEEDTVTVGQDLFVVEEGEADQGPPAKPEDKKEQQVFEKKPPAEQEQQKHGTDSKQHESKPELKKESKAEKPQENKDKSGSSSSGSTPAPPPQASSLPSTRSETRVKMSRMRLRIAERLKESQNAAASLTTFNEIDISSLLEMRARYKDEVAKTHDVKLGFMSAFARAAVLALREIRVANASIEGDEVVYRDYVDLAVAVATPTGLVTPVVRNAEALSFVAIERAIASLGQKARDNQLALEDMAGGTFTIYNGGVVDSLYGTPFLSLPQAAVLSMHSIKERPIVVDGQIVIRPIMVVALTYDHRLLDGREGTTFLVRVKEYIEDPRKMLLAP